MEVDLNGTQAIGVWMIVTGLILNTIIFVFSYYKIAARWKEMKEEMEGDEKKSEEEKKRFPIVRFIFHFRKFIKEVQDTDTKENFELVITFIKWTLLLGISLIVIGVLMFLFGFLF